MDSTFWGAYHFRVLVTPGEFFSLSGVTEPQELPLFINKMTPEGFIFTFWRHEILNHYN
jgi:hypothetical protein